MRNNNHQPKQAPSWTEAFSDTRYALRLSRRSPLASLAIVTTMALGIATTTAVFSATNAVLLRPLPFPGSDRVVELNAVIHGERVINSLAYPDLMDFRRDVPDIADLSVFSRNDVTLQHGTDPQLVRAVQVDVAYARVFGLRAALGRLIEPSDTALHAAKVAVLSYDFWMREFGGDRSLVGGVIRLDNEAVQVVGVLSPDAYIYPRESVELLTPLVIRPNSIMPNRGAMWANARGAAQAVGDCRAGGSRRRLGGRAHRRTSSRTPTSSSARTSSRCARPSSDRCSRCSSCSRPRSPRCCSSRASTSPT